jgi:hypothetical protein
MDVKIHIHIDYQLVPFTKAKFQQNKLKILEL